MQDKQYYSIGEVAKLCNVNIRTLHYYDDIGLLIPDYIDSINHYRYYTYAQVLEVMIIKEFKFIGFSLKEVKHLLKRDDLDFNREMLTKKCVEIDHTIQSLTLLKHRLQQHVSVLENRFHHEEHAIYRKSIEAQYVAYIDITCACTPEVFNTHYVDLLGRIEQHNLEVIGNRFAFFHGDLLDIDYQCAKVTLYIPIAKCEKNLSFIKWLPSHVVLATMHYGSYHHLANVHGELYQYAKQQHIATHQGVLHNFIINMATTKHVDDFITEVMLKIL